MDPSTEGWEPVSLHDSLRLPTSGRKAGRSKPPCSSKPSRLTMVGPPPRCGRRLTCDGSQDGRLGARSLHASLASHGAVGSPSTSDVYRAACDGSQDGRLGVRSLHAIRSLLASLGLPPRRVQSLYQRRIQRGMHPLGRAGRLGARGLHAPLGLPHGRRKARYQGPVEK